MEVSNRKIILSLLLYALLLVFGCAYFKFDGLYGQDGYAYLQQTKSFFMPKPQGEFWPPLYALAGWLLSLVFCNEIFSLQLVSIVSLTISAFILIQIIHHFYKDGSLPFYFIASCYLLSPFAVRSGVIVMSDAIATMFCLLTVYFIFVSTSYSKLFFVFLLATLALLSRYATAVVLFPLLAFTLVNGIKQKQWLSIISGGSIGFILLYLNFTYWANVQGSSQHAWLQNWEFKNFFCRSFTTADGSSTNTLPNIIYVFKNIFYPGFLVPFLPLLFFIKPGDFMKPTSLLLIASLFLYAFFLAGIPFQNERFLLVTFPLVLVLVYPAFVRMIRWKPYMTYAPLMIMLIALPIVFKAINPMYERNQLEKIIAAQLSSYQGKTLYAFDMDVSLQGRGFDFNYRNLWEKKYAFFEKGALVLFNEEKFSKQWENKNPMLNFSDLKNKYTLVKEKKLPEGWTLYSIQ